MPRTIPVAQTDEALRADPAFRTLPVEAVACDTISPMSHRLFLTLLAAVGIVAGVVSLLRSQPAPQPQPEKLPVTVLLRFGEQAKEEERWDGSVRVSGGTLLSVEGRHFSQGDEVLEGGKWRAQTRRDDVPLWADVHYTEMRPGSVPPVYHRPVGVYLKVEGPETARVSIVSTAANCGAAKMSQGGGEGGRHHLA